jgi:hypothetical protein
MSDTITIPVDRTIMDNLGKTIYYPLGDGRQVPLYIDNSVRMGDFLEFSVQPRRPQAAYYQSQGRPRRPWGQSQERPRRPWGQSQERPRRPQADSEPEIDLSLQPASMVSPVTESEIGAPQPRGTEIERQEYASIDECEKQIQILEDSVYELLKKNFQLAAEIERLKGLSDSGFLNSLDGGGKRRRKLSKKRKISKKRRKTKRKSKKR